MVSLNAMACEQTPADSRGCDNKYGVAAGIPIRGRVNKRCSNASGFLV